MGDDSPGIEKCWKLVESRVVVVALMALIQLFCLNISIVR